MKGRSIGPIRRRPAKHLRCHLNLRTSLVISLCLAGQFGVTMSRFAVLVVIFSLRAATAFHLGANTRNNESIAASAKVESASSACCTCSTFAVCSRKNALEEMVRNIGVCVIPLIISSPHPSFAEEQSGVGERHVGIAASKPTATTPDFEAPSAIECDEECKEQRRRRSRIAEL